MRNHSKILFVSLILVLLSVTKVAFCKAADQKLRPAEVTASGHPEWPPVMFQKGKTIVGAGPELVTKIFTELGLKVKIPYSGNWQNVLKQGQSGKIDVVVAAYKTKEREKFFVYSDSYTTDPVAIFAPADKTFEFTKLADLHGKTGIGMVGDSYGQKFDDYSVKHLNLQRVQTVREGLAKIAKHEADYFIYSLYAGKLEIKKNKQTGIVALPKTVSEQKFYILISKQSPFAQKLSDVNRLIKKYQKDGTVDRLLTQYE